MITSQKGIDLIKRFEGFRSKMYKDAVGLPTIGYGTLIDTEQEQRLLTEIIDEEEAEDLLKHDLWGYEHRINKLLAGVTANQNQFDAVASFCYNLGTTALKRSTLLKKILKNPNDPSIKKEFVKWVYAGGKKLKGLEKRRLAEATLYFEK